jgi:hypothetical protein
MASASKKLPVFKPPKNLAEAADMLYQLKLDRSELVRRAEQLKKNAAILRKHLIDKLPASKAEGVSGKIARVQIERKSRPVVEDRARLEKYIQKTGEFELLRASLNPKAVKERWDNKVVIPGVGKFDFKDVSLHKIKGRK